jgi:hypothetical protein
MRKLIVGILILFMTGLVMNEAHAQLSRKKLKKNNKRMSKFKGKKNGFDKNKKYNYIGVTLNSFNYFGDLSPLPDKISTDIKFTRPAVGLTFGHRFGPRYTVRGEFRVGTLRGSDFASADATDANAKFRYVRNLQFKNRVKELTVTGVFDLFKNSSTYINRVPLTPYAFVGVTAYLHNPQAFVGDDGPSDTGTWVDLQPLGTEGQNLDLVQAHSDLGIEDEHPNAGIEPYKTLQIAVPFGIGVRYKFNEVFDFSFEMGARILFTDYIDDVSGNYVDVTLFDDPLTAYLSDRSREVNDAESGTARDGEAVGAVTGGLLGQGVPFSGYGEQYNKDNIRGNSNDNDYYFVTTFRLSYVLGASFRKAKFR